MVSTSVEPPESLGDLLIEIGLVDGATLGRALALQKQSGQSLARVLVDGGFIDEDRFVRAVSKHLDLESVSLSTMKVHDRVLGRVPRRIARSARVLPIAIKRANQTDHLYVVVSDPCDSVTVDELERLTGCQLNLLVAPPTELDAAIDRYYGGGTPSHGVPLPRSSAQPALRGSVTTSAGGKLREDKEDGRMPIVPGLGLDPDDEDDGARTYINADDLELSDKNPTPVRTSEGPPPARDKTIARSAPLQLEESQLSGGAVPQSGWEEGRTLDVGIDDMDVEELAELLKPAAVPAMRVASAGTDTAEVDDLGLEDVSEAVVEDMATSEVDLNAEGVAEALGLSNEIVHHEPEVMRMSQGAQLDQLRGAFVSTMELPVDVGEKPSPFDAMNDINIPAGLERTGIIPVLDWDKGEFDPEPVSANALEAAHHLVGADDIPSSPAEVRARRDPGKEEARKKAEKGPRTAEDARVTKPQKPAKSKSDKPPKGKADKVKSDKPAKAKVEKPAKPKIEKPAKAKVEKPAKPKVEKAPKPKTAKVRPPAVSESPPKPAKAPTKRPVSKADERAPTQLAPMGAGAEVDMELANGEPTPPLTSRPEPTVVAADATPAIPEPVLIQEEVSAKPRRVASVHPRSEPTSTDYQLEEPVEVAASDIEVTGDAESDALVAALMAGKSLNSADRAQLVLAIGRLLLNKGIVTEEELSAMLSSGF